MNICIIDNFDSFTFNLLDELSGFNRTVHVWRNTLSAAEIEQQLFDLAPPRLLVFSPGPGHPSTAGSMIEVIKKLGGKVPIFGVCLGMQAIVTAFDGVVNRAHNVVHGKARKLEHNGEHIFHGLPHTVMVGRYHSLAALSLPTCLKVFGTSEDIVMAVHHESMPIVGIQFHPESILTTFGSKIIENTIRWAQNA